MLAAVVLLALATQAPPPMGAPMTPTSVEVQPLLVAEAGVMITVRASGDDELELVAIDPVRRRFELPRLRPPVGDGVWLELLSARLEPLAVVPVSLPPPDHACGLETPIPAGAWWALVVERRGEHIRIHGRLEIGPALAELVRRYDLPTV